MKPYDKLAWPALLALCLIALSSLLLWAAHRQLAQAQIAHREAEQHVRDETDRYQHTARDENLIRDTINHFEDLSKQGIIGAEHRLDWSDALRHLRESPHIARLEYELGPQTQGRALSASGDNVLAASPMKLRAGLLHEGDFFELIAALRAMPGAIVAPRSCSLAQMRGNNDPGINLEAECSIDWLTVSVTQGDHK